MRSVLTLSIFLATVFVAEPTYAQNLPWCAIMDNDGSTQCNYYTQQQCLQTLSGIGGECIQNPAGNAPQLAPVRRLQKMRKVCCPFNCRTRARHQELGRPTTNVGW